jgi:hypothetical protein
MVMRYGVQTNIEDRKLTDEALRTGERQFRLLASERTWS